MADFCQQCSIEIFGHDTKDCARPDQAPLEPGEGWPEICEGCGPTLVDNDGKCLADDCLKQHAAST
jgi:hypothetical protein